MRLDEQSTAPSNFGCMCSLMGSSGSWKEVLLLHGLGSSQQKRMACGGLGCRPSVQQSMGPCASSCRPASCRSKIGHVLRNSHVYRMAGHTCAAPQSPGLRHVAFCMFKQNMDQQMPPRHVLDAGEPWHDRVHQRPKTRGVNLACILQKLRKQRKDSHILKVQ